MATGSDGERRRSGFTLIELSIAVFIIAIIIAVAMPNFVRSYNAEVLNSMARNLSTSCEFAKLNAVLHQRPVAFYIDLDKQTIWLMQYSSTNGTDTVEPESQILKTIEFSAKASLVSAQIGEQMPQQKGQVEATFYPNGTCDTFAATLRGTEKGSGLQIIVDPVTCRGAIWPIKL